MLVVALTPAAMAAPERGLRPGPIILLLQRELRALSVQELLAIDPPAVGQRCPYDSSS